MSFQDIREFLSLLEKKGQLRRVKAPVRRELEITEIADRAVKGPAAQNHALLFERVEGSSMPVLINTFGTEERTAWALGVERLDELGEKVKGLLDLKMPGSLFEKFRKLGDLLDIARVGPKTVRSAPCQEVVETDNPSIAGLPILWCWPKDAGYYITFPLVITRDPVTGLRNVGTTGKERIPVAIALGGDPATMYSGTAPLPPGLDEILLAGWIRGKGVEMVKCRTCSRATATPRRRASRGRSATTRATTRSPTPTPSSTSPR
jgi:4-hydroxy-3-polyprenylbenzoate decarboxylase